GALWGIVTDGFRLRLVRDNRTLTRPAWIEADLGHLFEDRDFASFSALWLLIHQSRFGQTGLVATDCPLERWRIDGEKQGQRALTGLRDGVREAIANLGQGFLDHPGNAALRDALRTGTLTTDDYYRELLRLVYRLIFVLTAEARDLLHPDGTPQDARDRYRDGYALARVRDRAARQSSHDRHADGWKGARIVLRALAEGEPALGLPALGGIFATDRCPHLDTADVANNRFHDAVYKLAWIRTNSGPMPVRWRDMGTEELGSVYEGLLELVPIIEDDHRTFRFASAGADAGNARKNSGSYYTPSSLVQVLLDQALDPVIDGTIARHPAGSAIPADEALLSLAICDPACGSGHFLLAAARRLAMRITTLRTGGATDANNYRDTLREVIRRCLYGVDLNPMAVELCQVALWLEGVTPGRPLTFLDHRIRCGNSLVGASPSVSWLETMNKGIPSEAFAASGTDTRELVRVLRQANRKAIADRARGVDASQLNMGLAAGAGASSFDHTQSEAAAQVRAIVDAPEATVDDVRQVARAYSDYLTGVGRPRREPFDAWTAAFFWPLAEVVTLKVPGPPTSRSFAYPEAVATSPKYDTEGQVEVVADLALRHRFFHWPVEFPEVFVRGGFDCVLGNPPWERIKLQEQEFFAARDADIASARNAAVRKTMIQRLPASNPSLWGAYAMAIADAEATSQFVRTSGRYVRTGTGDVNLYALFAEHARDLINPHGRAGVIVPTGIATDDTTKVFFGHLVESGSLATLFDFENMGIFESVHNSYKFCLMTLSGSPVARGDLAFFLHDVAELQGDTGRRFQLSPGDFALINPNTRTCPTFRTRADTDLTRAIYRRVPVLINEVTGDNPWGVRFMRMIDMANDSGLFRDTPGPGRVPVYEAKLFHQFTHRWATYTDGEATRDITSAELADPSVAIRPRYWVDKTHVDAKLDGRWDRQWLLVYRMMARSTDERTWMVSALPRVAVGHSASVCLLTGAPTADTCLFFANVNNVLTDYVMRLKAGGANLSYFVINQLPVLSPDAYDRADRAFIMPRVVELTYTAWDLQAFARDMGMAGAPFRWDEARRAVMRAELDAWYAMKYGLTRK
ncbi:MAG: restriction endonuclease, partial [Actinobacteria bacterium]|nr:restriction endonuclease [Actinomycetota bacterium]